MDLNNLEDKKSHEIFGSRIYLNIHGQTMIQNTLEEIKRLTSKKDQSGNIKNDKDLLGLMFLGSLKKFNLEVNFDSEERKTFLKKILGE